MGKTAYFLYKTAPYDHQIDAFNAVYGREYFALFMQQGTGKSKVAIDVASNLYKEGKIDGVMLIAPNGVQEQWEIEQIPTHSPVRYQTLLWRSSNAASYNKELSRFIEEKSEAIKWFCVNVEAFSRDTHIDVFRRYLCKNNIMVIVDEATRIKSPEAQRTINIIQGLSEITKAGRRIVAIKPLSKYRAILTGTQVTNGPYNVWAMVEFLQHNYFGLDYLSFRSHYGIEVRAVVPNSYKSYFRKITLDEMTSIRNYAKQGKQIEEIARIMNINEASARFIIDNPSVKAPYKNLDELKFKISKIAFQVLKKDCFDLPDKTYEQIVVELSAEQKKIYNELVHELSATFAGKELSVLNKVTLIGRLQQITGGFFPSNDGADGELTAFSTNPKLNALIDDLEECSDFPVLVMARFVAEIKEIYRKLKEEYPDKRIEYICGEVTKGDRTEILESFKLGKVDVLVANAVTIGYGFNLQGFCHTQYYFSNSYSLEERDQSEDRIHRQGQLSDKVLYKDIIAKKTIDEKVLMVLKSKRDLLEYMRSTSIENFIGG